MRVAPSPFASSWSGGRRVFVNKVRVSSDSRCSVGTSACREVVATGTELTVVVDEGVARAAISSIVTGVGSGAGVAFGTVFFLETEPEGRTEGASVELILIQGGGASTRCLTCE